MVDGMNTNDQKIAIALLFLGFFLLGFVLGRPSQKAHAQVVGTVPTITNCVYGPSPSATGNIEACTVTDQWGISHLVVVTSTGGVAIAGGKQ